jgi:hypothetical protein
MNEVFSWLAFLIAVLGGYFIAYYILRRRVGGAAMEKMQARWTLVGLIIGVLWLPIVAAMVGTNNPTYYVLAPLLGGLSAGLLVWCYTRFTHSGDQRPGRPDSA